jgi:valyl-tRNA synthetase
MIMGALKFTGKVPFPHVYLHGILVDKQGHKLSKSRGNSPDPLEFIDEWGADTFRFGLLFPNPVDQGGYWDYEHIIEGSRNFITKLWNIVRLLSSLVPEGTPAPQRPAARPANLFDRWLLSRLGRLETEVDAALAGYEFTKAASALHQFIWHEYADWYVEAQKERLKGALGEEARRESAQVTLWAMDRALRMLHPIMPHVTEELWHVLPHEGEALATARWPTGSGIPDPDSEEAVGLLQEIVRGFRMLRKEAGWPESGRPEGTLSPTTGAARELLGSAEGPASVVGLAKLSSLSVKTGPGGPPGGVTTVVPGAELSLPRQGDGATRKDSLRKEQQTLEGLVSKSKARLADPAFRAKAPSAVVGEMEAKLAEMETRLQRIGELLAEGP